MTEVRNGRKYRGRPPKEVVADRERIAWDMAKRFHTQEEIAEELGVSQSAVSKMLKRVHNRVLTELSEQLLAYKMGQLEELEEIREEAIAAWKASKEPETSIRQRRSSPASDETGGGSAPAEHNGAEIVTSSVKERTGNPAYLKAALEAMRDIRKLFGLDAAEAYRLELHAGPEKDKTEYDIMPSEEDIAQGIGILYEAGDPVIVAAVQKEAAKQRQNGTEATSHDHLA